MFADLSLNLAASVIYDFGKAVLNAADKTETVQLARKKLGVTTQLNDFPDRYLEALVELRFEKKSKVVLDFFRSEDIMKTFYNYYYGSPDQRKNDNAHTAALDKHIEALQVGDAVKAENVDVGLEVNYFWTIFKQKVYESRTVREVEIDQQLGELKTSTQNAETLLQQLNDWLRQREAENIELEGQVLPIENATIQKALTQRADKIFNIEHIKTAHFHIYGEREIPRPLTPNPFLPEIFIGREDDLTAIHDKLCAPGGNLLLLVNGDGGVGKTSLAARYYHQYQHEYAHTAWVLSEKNIAGALLLLALPLGVQFEDTMNTEQRLERLLAAMAALDRPCLLVIDNANEVEDLQKHYLHLRRCPNFHLLLTSRITDFAQADRYRIEGLPLPEALKAFRTHYPKLQAAEEALVAQIHEAVGGNTLVLELLAKNLTQFNRLKTRYTLADLLSDLQQRGLLALTQSQAVDTAYQSKGGALRHEKPEDIIAAMYDLGDLTDEARALLSVFAVLPAERIGFETLEALLPNSSDLDTQLLALAQSGWLEYNEKEADFKCSPVVQQITKQKNKQRLLEDCRILINTLIKGLDSEVIHEGNYQRATQYTRYAETLLLSLKQNDDDLATLCQNIGEFHVATGNLSKAMAAYQNMASLQSRLLLENPLNETFKAGLSWANQFLGNTHTSLGYLDKALENFEDMYMSFKELYEAYPSDMDFKTGLAISYAKLGDTHSALGNLERALVSYGMTNKMFEELYEVYPNHVDFKNGLATSYSKLGETHSALGNLEKALTFFEEDLELIKDLYESYPNNVSFKKDLAISYAKLGETYIALGNLDKVLTFFDAETKLFEELYESYPNNVSFKNGLAISYYKLGAFSRDHLKDNTQAKEYFQQAEQLWMELVVVAPQFVQFKKNLDIVSDEMANLEG